LAGGCRALVGKPLDADGDALRANLLDLDDPPLGSGCEYPPASDANLANLILVVANDLDRGRATA
jgi:hypothetical protein